LPRGGGRREGGGHPRSRPRGPGNFRSPGGPQGRLQEFFPPVGRGAGPRGRKKKQKKREGGPKSGPAAPEGGKGAQGRRFAGAGGRQGLRPGGAGEARAAGVKKGKKKKKKTPGDSRRGGGGKGFIRRAKFFQLRRGPLFFEGEGGRGGAPPG